MTADSEQKPKQTKGQRTASRIMDVAEDLFATQGYDGTSLRQIADGAGIKEPGLYNHFTGKQGLYEAVLHRGLNPMAEALSAHLNRGTGLRDYTDLPAVMTDLLLEHPQMAALFQQALQGDSASVGNQLVAKWLETLFSKGMRSLQEVGPPGVDSPGEHNGATLAINVIALFNMTTGYFLSQRAFDSMSTGDLKDPDNVARQKRLLHKVIRAMLIS
jgi:AcrR family transcriptional regulator